MKFIADLHIHSHFSRATAKNLDPEHLAIWARKKGITLIGTGDFTHPGWLSELREKLVPADGGLFRLNPELEKEVGKEVPQSSRQPARFLLSGEISCIYKRADKTRKIHNLVLMPDFDAVEKLNARLDRIGNITSDGRPILGLDSRDLLEIVLEANERSFFIPAHIWTPWFSLFGSKSGFDVIEECFGDLTSHIHALETGLSSDPSMNRLLSALDDYLLVSNSDAHSPAKLGREANLFDTELDYESVCQAMTDGKGFEGTFEFFPEEGKYHLDGHRKCQMRFEPGETIDHNGICPACGKPITVGVLHRVMELADRKDPKLSKKFHCLIPLSEILSEILDCGPNTKKVQSVYEALLISLGPELDILMNLSPEEIEEAGGPLLAKAIDRMRRGKVIRLGGYDGEYGSIKIFDQTEREALLGQMALFQAPKKKKKAKKQTPSSLLTKHKTIKKKQTEARAQIEDPILDPLNPEQKSAVLHTGGHLLIVAGPGTGKTKTLTHRIAHLINSKLAVPENILALTFTNKAAREMEERINTMVPQCSTEGVYVSTFHGFCLNVLRRESKTTDLPPDFNICPEQDVPFLVRQVTAGSGKGKRIAGKILKNLADLKIKTLNNDKEDSSHSDLIPFFEQYQGRLRKLGMLDFDDLEVETLRLFRIHPEIALHYTEKFPWIFVDEYQDTNRTQVEILKALVNAGSQDSSHVKTAREPCAVSPEPSAVRICAIGDPDQAIYGFRGADVGNFFRFDRDFPIVTEIKLSRNYRSTQAILDASAYLMGKSAPLKGVGGKGGPIFHTSCRTDSEEAEMLVEQVEKLMGGTTYFSIDSGRVASHEEGEGISFGDIAVLYRLNAQGDALEKAFSRAGIPYVRSGEKPLIGCYPVNILWRFLQILGNPDNDFYRDSYFQLLGPSKSHNIPFAEINTNNSLSLIIERALAFHHLETMSDTENEMLGRFKEMAGNFTGNLHAFLDHITLNRGIDHELLYGDRIAMMSLHAAKGLEWNTVFMTGCEDGLLPCTIFGDRDKDEEKRLFHVGMTRAEKRLIFSYTHKRIMNGRKLALGPSPFLSLIPKDLCEDLERKKWTGKPLKHKQLGLFENNV